MYSLSVDVLKDLYGALKPALWIVNFIDGQSTSSKKHESFLDLTSEERQKAQAFRLILGANKYTISRKVNGELVSGFFYHIKAAYKSIFGSVQGMVMPFVEERMGFCYNQNGDAITIMFDHMGYIRGVNRKMLRIQALVSRNTMGGSPSSIQLSETIGQQVDEILAEPIKYSNKIETYKENINRQEAFADGTPTVMSGAKRNSVAVNTALFGKLEDLEALGTPPHIMIDNEEIIFGNKKLLS